MARVENPVFRAVKKVPLAVTNGKASVAAEMALRLEKAFGVSMDLLPKMRAGYDAAQARQCAAIEE